MSARRSACERFPEVIAAAVRVFAREGYRPAYMGDVVREAGLPAAAISTATWAAPPAKPRSAGRRAFTRSLACA
jgi:hypothetical protein